MRHEEGDIDQLHYAAGTPGLMKIQEFKQRYHFEVTDMAVALEEICQRVYEPNRLGVSAGDVIANDGCYVKHRMSTVGGMSGCVIAPIDEPKTLTAIHDRHRGRLV
ncbi:hypothetical protein WJX72_004125 [[Myrmecia] bisecta]|uniref:Uncharacterized protein n=1 Tax=[Myrmecia] bisecta TaxID=41462 RepID=A0AAW1P3T0_9CHLO